MMMMMRVFSQGRRVLPIGVAQQRPVVVVVRRRRRRELTLVMTLAVVAFAGLRDATGASVSSAVHPASGSGR